MTIRITASGSVHAFLVAGILGWAGPAHAVSCSNGSLAAVFGRHSKEMDAGAKRVSKLEGQYDKLCSYGQKTGTPLFERHVKAVQEIVKACGDPISRAVLLANRMNTASYKRNVAADCRRAEALRQPPQSAADYVARGKAFAEKRDYTRAVADFSEAIRLDAKLATAFYNRAQALHASKGDARAALADVLEAIRLDPQFGGSDYFSGGDSDRTIADNLAIADEAIAAEPAFGNAYATRSSLYIFKRDYDAAIRDASKAVSIYADDAAALNNRGVGYMRKANLEAALSDLDEAILQSPKASAMYRNRGYARLQKGDLDSALADLDQAIRLDPKQQPAFAWRGQVDEKSGQRDKAIADYTAALFLDESRFSTVGLDAYLLAGQRLTAMLNEEKAPK